MKDEIDKRKCDGKWCAHKTFAVKRKSCVIWSALFMLLFSLALISSGVTSAHTVTSLRRQQASTTTSSGTQWDCSIAVGGKVRVDGIHFNSRYGDCQVLSDTLEADVTLAVLYCPSPVVDASVLPGKQNCPDGQWRPLSQLLQHNFPPAQCHAPHLVPVTFMGCPPAPHDYLVPLLPRYTLLKAAVVAQFKKEGAVCQHPQMLSAVKIIDV